MIVPQLSHLGHSFTFEGHFFTWGLEAPQIGRVRMAPARMAMLYVVGSAPVSLSMGESGFLYIYLNHRLVYGLDHGADTAEIAKTAFAARGLQAMVELGLRAWAFESRRKLS